MLAALRRPGSIERVSWLFVVLLASAIVVLVGAEWPRLAGRAGPARESRRPRMRRRRSHLRVVPPSDEDISADEFAASVQRDLSRLPTIEERDRRR
jgi:hypothetical protein